MVWAALGAGLLTTLSPPRGDRTAAEPAPGGHRSGPGAPQVRQAGPAPLRACAGPLLRDPQEEHPALQQLHLPHRLSPAALRPRFRVVACSSVSAGRGEWAPRTPGAAPPSGLMFGIKQSPCALQKQRSPKTPRPRRCRRPPPTSLPLCSWWAHLLGPKPLGAHEPACPQWPKGQP